MKHFYTTKEVAAILRVHDRTASNRIRMMNDELQQQGYWIEPGKIPVSVFHQKYPYIKPEDVIIDEQQ